MNLPDFGNPLLTRPATGQAAYIRLIDVVKRFDDHLAVDHLSLDIRKNELFALLGSSGCGKSTLLRIMAGLETPTSGQVLIDGEDVTALPPYRRPVNMMFQSYALFPHLTVEANVAFGLQQEGAGKADIAERVDAALQLVEMGRYARRKPHQLSGGQQQRVALARSLVKRPKLLLLDEPMSALDKKIRQQTQLELMNILDKVGVTCVMVTHDQEEAMTMADRLAVMSDGRIVQQGTPHDVYEYPNSRFTAGFIGSTNLFDGLVVEDEPAHVRVECADLPCPLNIEHGVTGPSGMEVSVSIRPEQIQLSHAPLPGLCNWARGHVSNLAYMGSYSLYHVTLPSGKQVIANLSRTQLATLAQLPALGDEVYLGWSSNSGVVLTR